MAFLPGYNKRIPLTVITGQMPGTETDFPVLVYQNGAAGIQLPDVGFWDTVVSGEYAFGDDSGTKYSADYISLNIGSKILQVRVKVPSIAVGTVLYLYFDNPGAGETSDTNTYSNGYECWYPQDEGSGNAIDRAGNINLTAANITYGQTGKVEDGFGYNGTSSQLSGTSPGNTNYTASAWVNTTDSANQGVIEWEDSTGIRAGLFLGTGRFPIAVYQGANPRFKQSTTAIPSGTLTKLDITFNGTSAACYINGSAVTLGSEAAAGASANNNLFIGRAVSGTQFWFDGIIDEARIADSARSDSWITSMYNVEVDNSAFWNVSAIEGAGDDIDVPGIASAEAVGSHTVQLGAAPINVPGVASAEAVGTHQVNPGPVSLDVPGVASAEAIGAVSLVGGDQDITVPGIPSAETVGTVQVAQGIQFVNVPGIPSAESVGTLSLVGRTLSALMSDMETDIDDVFLDEDDFAESVTYEYATDGSRVTLSAIFDKEFIAVDPDTGTAIMSNDPVVWVKTSDFAKPLSKGDRVQIRGAWFQMISSQPDGTGVSVLELNRDSTV